MASATVESFVIIHSCPPIDLKWYRRPSSTYPSTASSNCHPGSGSSWAPRHTPGSQVVVNCGDTAVFFRELDELRTEGQRLVGVLDPELLWLSHQPQPWRPHRQRGGPAKAGPGPPGGGGVGRGRGGGGRARGRTGPGD